MFISKGIKKSGTSGRAVTRLNCEDEGYGVN
jgi:hypothetical protein